MVQAAPSQRVLIVDDDPNNLTTLGNLLSPHYEVLAALSGERALQIAASKPHPALMLLDVMMPQMDGYDVLARLLGDSSTHDLPVIFVTGRDSADDEEKGLELGAVDYITKPYRSAVVLARVRTQLELDSGSRKAASAFRGRPANGSFHLLPMTAKGTYADLSIMWTRAMKWAPTVADERRARISLSA